MEKSQNLKISEALATLRPQAQWVLRGDDYSGLEWLDENQMRPDWEEVLAEINNPTPKPQPSIEEKLQFVGLNLEDLKSALGLN